MNELTVDSDGCDEKSPRSRRDGSDSVHRRPADSFNPGMFSLHIVCFTFSPQEL